MRRSWTAPPASATRALDQRPAGPRRTVATIRRPFTHATAASPSALIAVRGRDAPRPETGRAAASSGRRALGRDVTRPAPPPSARDPGGDAPSARPRRRRPRTRERAAVRGGDRHARTPSARPVAGADAAIVSPARASSAGRMAADAITAPGARLARPGVTTGATGRGHSHRMLTL